MPGTQGAVPETSIQAFGQRTRTAGGYRIVGPLMLRGRGSLTASLAS